MSVLSESYAKVQYDLRPAKQVERRMIIDSFQLLAMGGFPIRDYQYTGMGSIYFVDFVLFHKFLGMERMLSVEASEAIQKRVSFNRPYGTIDIAMGPISNFIPGLSQDRKHILWLDYDNVMCAEYLRDIVQASTKLPPASVLLVTIDVEPPGHSDGGPEHWCKHFIKEAGDYLDQPIDPKKHFARSKLPGLNIDLIRKAIFRGLIGRRDIEFFPLFNFLYADGHKMITVGGMFATQSEKSLIRASRIDGTPYFRGDLNRKPYEIKVPRLTRKERLHLDATMPCSNSWRPKDFELSERDLLSYREVYKFLPAYAELLL